MVHPMPISSDVHHQNIVMASKENWYKGLESKKKVLVLTVLQPLPWSINVNYGQTEGKVVNGLQLEQIKREDLFS